MLDAEIDDRIHTFKDLEAWDKDGTFLAVLGYPIQHSLSPPMHNRALRAMAKLEPRFSDWTYVRFELPPHLLGDALPLFHARGFRGLNLTIPHKVDALDLIADVDPAAARMGAVNTLLWEAGGYRGFNTDGFGISRAVEEAFGAGLAGRHVTLLGAGGAARAVAVECLQSGCQRLRLVNRSEARLRELEARLRAVADAADRVEATSFNAFGELRLEHTLVINVTSLGLKPEDAAPVDLSRAGEGVEVFDSTYGCRNALARAASQHGVPYSDGLPMLVWQGVRSLEIWTGASVPAAKMFEAAREKLAARAHS